MVEQFSYRIRSSNCGEANTHRNFHNCMMLVVRGDIYCNVYLFCLLAPGYRVTSKTGEIVCFYQDEE